MGLFTLNSSNATRNVLRSFRLKRFFDVVVTREGVSRVKPDVSHLKTVLMLLNVKPEEAVVVGDSVLDMKSAKALGAFAVGVITGFSTAKELMNAGATCLITSLTDLPQLVKEINDYEGRS
jgi:phosphoglycolate phosphatase-like HAD superfamily hydrolase